MKARYGAPLAGDERAMLCGYLDHYRQVMITLCEGVNGDDLVRPDEMTGYSVLGLIKHLTLVERTWFAERVAGEDIGYRWDPDDPNEDFRIEKSERPREILDGYRSAIEGSRQIVAERSLDDNLKGTGYEDYTLRWVMLNMIVEVAGHAGHADILRERLDGRTGVGYGS